MTYHCRTTSQQKKFLRIMVPQAQTIQSHKQYILALFRIRLWDALTVDVLQPYSIGEDVCVCLCVCLCVCPCVYVCVCVCLCMCVCAFYAFFCQRVLAMQRRLNLISKLDHPCDTKKDLLNYLSPSVEACSLYRKFGIEKSECNIIQMPL